jgi:AGCS family alanine or glycine:cation symporter
LAQSLRKIALALALQDLEMKTAKLEGNMEQIVKSASSMLWGNAMILLCLGAGVIFAVRFKFFQIRYLKESIRLIREKNIKSSEGISPFQAFTMALAGRIGTGNIVGVITAIATGGPGAVFWMWILAILGAGTSLVECTLAQIYKVRKFGEYRGGPAFYLEKGLGQKWLGILFAFFCAVGNILLIPGVHANAITSSLKGAFGLEKYLYGIFLVILLGVIIFGNVKRIAKVSEVIVPIMSVAYIFLALIIIFVNIGKLPEVFALIFRSAFGMDAVFGGIVGSAINMGIKRGVNSSSAGMGTAPQSAAAAEVSHPVKQGMVQAISVYFDTLLVCTATALMILITNAYNVTDASTGQFVVNYLGNVENGAIFAQKAAETVFPHVGSILIAISLFFFSSTSLMAAYYIGETNIIYFIGEERIKKDHPIFLIVKVVFLCMVMFGSVRSGGLVWQLNDIGTGLMVWVNLFSIIFLSGIVKKAVDDYEMQLKAGKNPVFNPDALAIKNAETWTDKAMVERYSNNV